MLSREFYDLHQSVKGSEIASRLPVKLEPMDLSVTLAFEEDLKDLVFPKIKELSFRVNRHMPVELAAKLLALKNDHKEFW